MTLRTSLVITGDSSGAQAALKDLSGDMNRAGAAAEALVASERQVEAATEGLEAELRQAQGAIRILNEELREAREVSGALAGRVDVLETQLARAGAAGRVHARSMGEQALGARMLGQQLQDMGIMASMGVTSASDVLRILSMQAGQTALAVEQMGVRGAAGRVAAFMGSAWGSAIMAATMVLGPLILKLFEWSDAAEEAAQKSQLAAEGADAFGDAQSSLGKLIDLTTGKLKSHNVVLAESIRLQLIYQKLEGEKELEKAEKDVRARAQAVVSGSFGGSMYTGPGGPGGGTVVSANPHYRDVANRFLSGAYVTEADPTGIRGARIELEKLADAGGKLDGKNVYDFVDSLNAVAKASEKIEAAKAGVDAIDGKGVDPRFKPYERPKTPPKPRSTEARDEFGRDAADKIAAITEQFERTPGALRQANGAIRQLDDLIDDLGRKKPPNFETLIASAQEAKRTVRSGLIASIVEPFDLAPPAVRRAAEAMGQLDESAAKFKRDYDAGLISKEDFDALTGAIGQARVAVDDGLNRPFTEFIRSQGEALSIQRLMLRGQFDQADAQRTILQLERQIGPLSQERKDAILASVQALRAEERQLDRLYDKQRRYLDAIGDVRADLRGAIYDGFEGLADLPGQILTSFRQFTTELLTEQLFGPAIEALQDEVQGTNIVEDAAGRFAEATDTASGALGRLEDAVNGAAAAYGGPGGSGSAAANAMGVAIADALAVKGDAQIVVEGNRFGEMKNPREFFADMTAKLLGGLGIDEEKAKWIGGAIGDGLEGALYGQLGGSALSLLGVRTSSTGSALGGAAGSLAAKELLSGILGSAAGPIGGIFGGLLGGALGGLLNKPKYATASLTSSGGASISGNKDSLREASGSLAGQVQDGLASIAEQLGGIVGDFSVAIGTWDGKYRVNTNATNKALHYNNFGKGTLKDFGDDQSGAVAYAILDAIKDGAVTGLSAAVQQALRSSDDIEKALTEAMKVGDLETLLGGTPAALAREFKNFEREAQERLRIARQYGFDIVEVEKLNAKQRLELSDKLLEEQVGSLQRLVQEMTSGSMFEGTSVDRRNALLGEIAKAQADMDAGVSGAADRLAELFSQLNDVSEAVYGTTGGFAADRSAILDQARAAIAKANAEIQAAKGETSDPALAQTNAALDENNDQNAQIIAALERANTLNAQVLKVLGQPRTGNLRELARIGA